MEDAAFEVERIVDCVVENGVPRYLVRWTGLAAGEDTWEPAENFADLRFVDAYHREHPIEPGAQRADGSGSDAGSGILASLGNAFMRSPSRECRRSTVGALPQLPVSAVSLPAERGSKSISSSTVANGPSPAHDEQVQAARRVCGIADLR